MKKQQYNYGVISTGIPAGMGNCLKPEVRCQGLIDKGEYNKWLIFVILSGYDYRIYLLQDGFSNS